ncbi:MAG: Ribose 5-phosphate isomerase [Phycisphaerales bacterium]|nr:Ribose 5-phosphate isomerase [Phycisphaerales bacterium]
MRIAVACDHRGYEAKRRLTPVLKAGGHAVEDFGCDGVAAVDYPDFAAPVARAVAEGRADVGILMDGSGIGMCVAANKVRGARAALVYDHVTARRAREHNHCNVLCLGSDLLGEDQVRQIVDIFLSTGFGDGRHARRTEKVCKVETEECGPPPAAKPAG